jgi:hypothetical protein
MAIIARWYTAVSNDTIVDGPTQWVEIGPTLVTQEDLDRQQEALERARREREDAWDRAVALLLEHLDGEQAADWRDVRCFSVTAASGRRYVIHDKESVNITRLNEDGSEECRFCIVCDPEEALVPQPDLYLAQMLLLLTDEEAFERIAARHERASTFFGAEAATGYAAYHVYGPGPGANNYLILPDGLWQENLGQALGIAWNQT